MKIPCPAGFRKTTSIPTASPTRILTVFLCIDRFFQLKVCKIEHIIRLDVVFHPVPRSIYMPKEGVASNRNPRTRYSLAADGSHIPVC